MILWTKQARKDMKRLSTIDRKRIIRAITRFHDTGFGNVASVRTWKGVYCLKISGYRIFFKRSKENIEIIAVRHRKAAYG